MIINTKSHPNKQVYKEQFTELLNVDKLSYGIISDVNPKTKNSPLWCEVVHDNKINVKKGSVVFKDGTVAKLSNDTDIFFNYIDSGNKVFYIVIEAIFLVSETGINEFNEEKNKSIKVSEASVYITEEFDEDNTICLGAFKSNNSTLKMIDSNKENFANVRPWYSPKDIKHELIIGSGKITNKNPHGISYNDIDSNNTLHNKLLSSGVVLSKHTDTQDVCGELKEYKINKNEVKFDSDNSMFGSFANSESTNDYTIKTNYAYFVLPDIPINIVSIKDISGNQLKDYIWVEHTSLIRVNVNRTKIKDFVVKYYCESSLEPYVSNESNGVSVKDVRENCVIFSEGKSLKEINKDISFSELENIPNNYSVYLDSNGTYVKVPSFESSDSLDNAEGNLTTLFSRSRLEFIVNDNSKNILKCPISIKGQGTCNKEVEIYQSFGLYSIDDNGNKILKNESKICPNPFIPSVASGENKLYLQCENSNQKNIECKKLEKVNFRINNSTYSMLFNSRENKTIYGGIDIDFEFLSNNETNEHLTISISHGDRTLDIVSTLESSSLSIHSDLFDFKNCYGEWNVSILSSQRLYVNNFAISINFSKIEPIFYSKFDDTYTRLKVINENNGIFEVNPFYGSITKVNDNENFYIKLNVVGTSNGENITETIEFDSKYRNQDYLNSKLSNNVFDEVFKYNIADTNVGGRLTILAYPVGNVNNMCGVFNCSYKNNKVSKLYDARKVCPNLMYENKNIIGKTSNFVSNINNFIVNEQRKNYFEIRNISSSSINITLYSTTAFYADIVRNKSVVDYTGCDYDNDNSCYKISVTLNANYSIRSYNQTVSDDLIRIVEVENDELANVEIVHWDNSWTTLKNLCTSMKSLSKIPNSWDGCSNITTLENAFRDSNVSIIPRVWNGLNSVVNLDSAFENSKISYIPSSWNGLGKVTSMKRCFKDCTNLKISELNFVGLNLRNDGIEYAFYGVSLGRIVSFEGLENITSIRNTFANSNLNELPDSWSFLENLIDSSSAFESCKFTSMPKSWYGLNKVENAKSMFKNCTKLEYIPNSWLGLDSVISIEELFYNCSSVKDGGYEDVESMVNVKYYDNAFYGMTSWKVDADTIYEILDSISGDNNA